MFFSLVGVSVLSAFRLELRKAREIGGRLLAVAAPKRSLGKRITAIMQLHHDASA
jgi:hypothetical protein